MNFRFYFEIIYYVPSTYGRSIIPFASKVASLRYLNLHFLMLGRQTSVYYYTQKQNLYLQSFSFHCILDINVWPSRKQGKGSHFPDSEVSLKFSSWVCNFLHKKVNTASSSPTLHSALSMFHLLILIRNIEVIALQWVVPAQLGTHSPPPPFHWHVFLLNSPVANPLPISTNTFEFSFLFRSKQITGQLVVSLFSWSSPYVLLYYHGFAIFNHHIFLSILQLSLLTSLSFSQLLTLPCFIGQTTSSLSDTEYLIKSSQIGLFFQASSTHFPFNLRVKFSVFFIWHFYLGAMDYRLKDP